MALINKTPFVLGTVYTPEVATEMAGVTFDDQPQYFGHYPRIDDTSLSNVAGQIKDRVAGLSSNLKVTTGSGLNCTVAAGSTVQNGNRLDFSSFSLALVPSATNFICCTIDGSIEAYANTPPIIRAILAKVVTNSVGIVSIVDLREGFALEVIRPASLTIKSFGGRGELGTFTASNGDILMGELNYQNYLVPVGVTVTVARYCLLRCAGDFTCDGTINVNYGVGGGNAKRTKAVRYLEGDAGGGVNVSSPGETFNPFLSPYGTGGQAGGTATDFSNNDIVTSARGGSSGGGFLVEAANNIKVTGSINADAYLIQGATGALSAPGATAATTFALGGGGGGGGGSITLKAINSIVVSGILTARGGNGGDSSSLSTSSVRASGAGAGGGGGYISLYCSNINTTGSSLLVTRGVAGANPGGHIPAAGIFAAGGNGGSFGGLGGLGGSFATPATPATVGIILIKNFTPVG